MIRFLFALLALLFPLLAAAAEPLPLDAFGQLPVAHQGRIKPLSVFAREQLRDLSGETLWQKHSAIHWLAHMLFMPEKMDHERLILLESDVLREMLDLPPHPHQHYSLTELRKAMQPHLPQILEAMVAMDRKQPVTPLQEKLVELFQRIRQFQQLQDSLNIYLPLPGNPNNTFEAFDLKKEKNPLLAQMEERGRQNHLLAIVPSPWPGDEDWYTPWELRFNGKGSPQTATLLHHWQAMLTAYRHHDATGWKQAVAQAGADVATKISPFTLLLEEGYYRFSLLSLAIAGYLAFAIFSFLPFPLWLNKVPLLAALGCHGMALLVRMFVLGRPPVSNLYESVLFVSLLLAAAGILMGWKSPKLWLLRSSSFATAGLLLLSQTLLAGQEQLPVVMAVLNTNFWLGTHVICITAGYAAAVLTSLLAHYHLWQRQSTATPIHLFVLLSLLLTAIGTLLGGIWADQSWGRFWGWDPKENGALLIVLWLIWLLHARLAGQMSERVYLAGLSYLSVIVALAWFGVNLLSVGLHSYGFTEGTAWGLIGFILVETLLIAYLGWCRSRKISHA